MVMEPGALQSLIEEHPSHLVIGSLHVKLDGKRALAPGGSLKVMHEFLSNENVVGEGTIADKNPLLSIDWLGKDRF